MLRFRSPLLFTSVIIAIASCGSPDNEHAAVSDAKRFEFRETVVAGGARDFMEVRHLLLRGTNYNIGKKLADIARKRHNSRPIRYPNMRDTYEQIQYFKEFYPAHFERMRGVAATYDRELSYHALNFAGLYYGLPLSNCSVIYYPPATTASGTGVMSRNFDFTTGTIYGTEPGRGGHPACARPYIIEMYPDRGYASLVICCFDLLGGACDGINSEGLTVAMLADSDVIEDVGINATPGPRAGLNEIQIVRYLLDTCADVREAKAALRQAKLYYNMFPNHYIIADRHGRSFIWENAPSMNTGYIIDGSERPLVSVNFLFHRYPDLNRLPPGTARNEWFERYGTIRDRIDQFEGKFDDDFIRETNRCVSITHKPPPGGAIFGRTLWHALYYTEERRMEVDFYLGEKASAGSEESPIRRSGYITFELEL